MGPSALKVCLQEVIGRVWRIPEHPKNKINVAFEISHDPQDTPTQHAPSYACSPAVALCRAQEPSPALRGRYTVCCCSVAMQTDTGDVRISSVAHNLLVYKIMRTKSISINKYAFKAYLMLKVMLSALYS